MLHAGKKRLTLQNKGFTFSSCTLMTAYKHAKGYIRGYTVPHQLVVGKAAKWTSC